MNGLCWLDLGFFGISSRQVRNFIRKYRRKFNRRGIDITYSRLDWCDLLYGKDGYIRFLEKNRNKKILARYRGPERRFEKLSKKESGQNRYLPGEEYVKFFTENIESIDEKLRKDLDVEFINPAESIAIARDKFKTTQILRSNGIATPETFLIHDVDEFEGLLDKYGSVFMKPPGGAYGRGAVVVTKVSGAINGKTSDTYWIKTKYDLDDNLQLGRETKTFHTNDKEEFSEKISKILKISSLVQPNIKTPPLEDLYGTQLKWDMRVVMSFPDIYQKIVSATMRAVPYNEIVTNLSAGGEAYNLEKIFVKEGSLKRDFDLGVRGLENLRTISMQASKLLGLNEVGIDFMLSKDDLVPYLIEANAAPEYRAGYYSGILIGEFTVCGMLQHVGFKDPFVGLRGSTFEDEDAVAKMIEEYMALQTVAQPEKTE